MKTCRFYSTLFAAAILLGCTTPGPLRTAAYDLGVTDKGNDLWA